jgi:hypothetical protein
MSLRFKLATMESAMLISVCAAVAFAAPAFAKDDYFVGVTDGCGVNEWAYTT